MLTDSPPRKNYAGFLESEGIKTLDLSQNGHSQETVKRLEAAMKADSIRDVRGACTEFLKNASNFYKVPTCGICVLAARPLRTREHGTYELFGDYTPGSMLIRLWMRTAVRKEVTSFGTFLSTLCHEFCHHLDFKKFGYSGFLRKGRRSLSLRKGNVPEEIILGSYGRRTLADRLATHESVVSGGGGDAIAATHPSVAPRSSQNSAPVHV
jgi:hypothetical protein